jgi:hypothetical protein
MDIYPTPAELIRDVPLDQPIIDFGPHTARCAGRWFCANFRAKRAMRKSGAPVWLAFAKPE